MKLSSLDTFVPILTILLVTGCAGVKTPPNIIFQDSTYLVRLDLDRSIEGPDDPNSHTHPLKIEVGQLHTIFEATHVQEHRALLQRAVSSPATPVRVFSKDDIVMLAPQVREAFLQATPQQHVVFAVINPTGKRHEVTAGEMFVKDTALHLILHCFQSFEGNSSRSTPCGPISQQAYGLNFAEKEYFVGFGNVFVGHGKKEIIVDYNSIPSSNSLR